MKGKIVLFLLFLLGISLWADNYFPEKQVYYIEQIERDDGELSFDFAVPIDPASVTSESIYVNDELANYGVDQQPVTDGDVFRLEYTTESNAY